MKIPSSKFSSPKSGLISFATALCLVILSFHSSHAAITPKGEIFAMLGVQAGRMNLLDKNTLQVIKGNDLSSVNGTLYAEIGFHHNFSIGASVYYNYRRAITKGIIEPASSQGLNSIEFFLKHLLLKKGNFRLSSKILFRIPGGLNPSTFLEPVSNSYDNETGLTLFHSKWDPEITAQYYSEFYLGYRRSISYYGNNELKFNASLHIPIAKGRYGILLNLFNSKFWNSQYLEEGQVYWLGVAQFLATKSLGNNFEIQVGVQAQLYGRYPIEAKYIMLNITKRGELK